MNKAKKVLALLMALCMALGMFSLSAFAGGALQNAIDAAPAGGTISFGGFSGPVVISKDITINFEDGAKVWSNEATPAITIANGAKVTLDGVTAGVSSPVNFDKYDAMDLPDAYLAASVPAIRVANNAELNLKNSVVTGGEAKFVSTDIYVPVGAGVETYDNSVVNVENSIVFGTWGVENTSKTVVNIAPTSIVAGYMDATAALYKTNVVNGYKLSSVELAEAFLNDACSFDDEQAEIAEDLLGYRVYAVVEAAPTAVNGLTSVCVDGEATISFDKEDTLWVPKTFTLGEETKDLVLDGNKYTVAFSGIETDTYDYSVDYELRTDLGQAAGTINDFVEDFARDYWPDLNGNVNDAIDHVLSVAADELESQLIDAYKNIRQLQKDANKDNSPLKGLKTDLRAISSQFHWILGDDVFEQIVGTPSELEEARPGTYYTILNYFKELKAADGFVAKAAYIRDNYQKLWNDIAGEEGDTLNVHIKAIYNVLDNNNGEGSTIAQLIDLIETNPDVAALVGDDFANEIKDIKGLLKDAIDGIKEAQRYYNEIIGGAEIQDYLAFATNENLAEGDRLLSNIKTYYVPDFDGTKLLVKEEILEGSIDITNVLTTGIKTEVTVSNNGSVVASTGKTIYDNGIIVSDDSFTLSAVGDDDIFLYWTNAETDKVWSYDDVITINPTNDKSLKAVFGPDEEGDNYLFINQNNVYVTSGDSLEDAPNVPATLYGGKMAFKNWELAAEKGEFIKIYRAVYEVVDNETMYFRVGVLGEAASIWNIDEAKAYEEDIMPYLFKEAVYVVADEEFNGETFSYWKDQNDKIVSYNRAYTFVAVRDVTLKPVYEGATENQFALNTVFLLKDGTLNMFAERSVVPGSPLKVVEVGMLLCAKTSMSDDDIKVGASNISRMVDKVTSGNYSGNGTYWGVLNANTFNTLAQRHIDLRVRGYVVFQNTVTGALTTEYAPVATYDF
jgi:hypothetical protein